MSTTNQALAFLQETRQALESLSQKLTTLRTDLCGHGAESKGPNVPAHPEGRSYGPFFAAVEQQAAYISAAINQMHTDLDILTKAVDHQPSASVSR